MIRVTGLMSGSLAVLLAACAGAPSGDIAHDGTHAGVQRIDDAGTTVVDPHAHHKGAGLSADEPLTGSSVYLLEERWTDHLGAERQLAELRGTPQAIAMVYTNCGSACPQIVADMKRLEAAFPHLGLVLVSIDPERDTPDQLRSFFTGTRLNDRWTLLSGSDDSIAMLAAVLGVRYRQVSATDFLHSNVITVLDGQGNIVYRQEALGETDGTMKALERLTAAAYH